MEYCLGIQTLLLQCEQSIDRKASEALKAMGEYIKQGHIDKRIDSYFREGKHLASETMNDKLDSLVGLKFDVSKQKGHIKHGFILLVFFLYRVKYSSGKNMVESDIY